MIDHRFTVRFAALLMAGSLVAGCSSTAPKKIDYRSDTKTKSVSLATPPNMLDENADQRSLPPQGGETSLTTLQQVQQQAPTSTTNVLPQIPGMHIQRDGTESWLVIDNMAPAQVWPQVRRFWQEQGFLLVVDQRDKGVMETDWNETHPSINEGLIRNTISKAMGNSYVAAQRDKYRTRLESAPGGGTYVFVSQKGLREELTGLNNDSSKWAPRPNDPGLETEYLKRLMVALGRDQANRQASNAGGLSPAGAQVAPGPVSASDAQATAAQNVALAAQLPPSSQTAASNNTAPGAQYTDTELTLEEPYDRAWLRVGLALDRSNFTVDDRDRSRGLYFIRYVDPKDLSSAEQGFWNQVFHGKKEKVAKQYRLNVRAITENQTRVAIVDDAGNVDDSQPAKQIMALVIDQFR